MTRNLSLQIPWSMTYACCSCYDIEGEMDDNEDEWFLMTLFYCKTYNDFNNTFSE